jgi:hypothetical protein
LRGFPGILRLPIIKQLFSNNDDSIGQTDIVMLLTPRIVRTHELTQQDVSPIYIGTQQNLSLGGAPPLIALPTAQPPDATEPPAPAGANPAAPAPAGTTPAAGAAPQGGGVVVVPPGSNQLPGKTTLPAAPAPQPAAPAAQEPPAGPTAALVPPAQTPGAPGASPAGSGGEVVVSPPGTEFRVGGGPYTVPVSISGASRLSSLSLTITYNPAVLRVRTVQEGSFMRTGGIAAAFTQQVDAASGRVDIAIVRTGDTTGVAGTGLLAALLFDAVGPGSANLAVTGTGTAPGGAALGLQFGPVSIVTVR